MQQQFEIDGQKVVIVQQGDYEHFYKIVGEGFETRLELEAVQKGADILMVANNERLSHTSGENLFKAIGGVNFAEVCGSLLKRVSFLNLELTANEKEGELIALREEHKMKSFINMSAEEVKDNMLSISFLSGAKLTINDLDIDDVFFVLANSYNRPTVALEKLVQMFGYENLSAFETKISKILKFRNEFLITMGQDEENGLGLNTEYVNAYVEGLGDIRIRTKLRGNFSLLSGATRLVIGDGDESFYLNNIRIAKNSTF